MFFSLLAKKSPSVLPELPKLPSLELSNFGPLFLNSVPSIGVQQKGTALFFEVDCERSILIEYQYDYYLSVIYDRRNMCVCNE